MLKRVGCEDLGGAPGEENYDLAGATTSVDSGVFCDHQEQIRVRWCDS